jgi:predicted phosphate transport protein (TIGR00153 family)
MPILEKLFPRSPFGPLLAHAKKVQECVALLRPLTDAWLREDWSEVDALQKKISEKEHEADRLKVEIRQRTPKPLFYSVPRGDLLRILNNQDDIADAAEDYGVLLTLRRTSIPSALKDAVMAYVEQALGTVETLHHALEELTLLAEASFSGPEADKVLKRADEVGKMEWETDKLGQSLIRKLIDHEATVDPLTIIFAMRLFEKLGQLANHAENCGDNLRHLILSRT